MKTKLSILVISNLYPPHTVGGHEVVCGRVTDALRSRGYDITVLTSRWAREGSPAGDSAIRILELLHPDLVPRRGPMILARRYRVQEKNYHLTRGVIDDVAPDIVYAWGMGHITLGPALAAQDAGLKVVFDNGDCALVRQSPHGLARLVALGLMKLVPRRRMGVDELDVSFGSFVSESLKKEFLEASLPVEHWPVIHRGIPRDMIRPRRVTVSDGPRKILYAGQVHPVKGVDVVVGAMKHIADHPKGKNCLLTVVGTGPKKYIERLKAKARRLRIHDKVIFSGHKPPDQMPGIYDRMDIMVFSSVWQEPLSVGRLEAMARGMALVSTDTGGGQEVVKHEENALVVPPREEAATAQAVLRLVEDPGLMQRISDGAVQTIRDHFLFENVIETIEDYLSHAAHGHDRRLAGAGSG